MSDPAALTSLLARVEAATGADREIDAFLALCFPEPNSGCWLWVGSATQDRYGYWKTRFKGKVAARAAYELLRGGFDPQAFICHHCDNSACVNPDHLYVGDHRTNMEDMRRRRRAFACRQPERAKEVGRRLGLRNTWTQGAKNPKAKLSEAAVRALRNDPRPAREIAAELGVDPTTVHRAKRGGFIPIDRPPPTRREATLLARNSRSLAEQNRACGDRHWSSKLTVSQAAAIRDDWRSSTIVAKEYGIHIATVCKIRAGETWAKAIEEFLAQKESADV